MTVSPKNYPSNFTSSSANRGVEAKEIEVGNTDMYCSNSLQLPPESSNASGSVVIAEQDQPLTEDTASYIQVVVQKQRRQREAPCCAAVAAQTSARLPICSSPKAAGVYVLGAHPVLFTAPQPPQFHSAVDKDASGGNGARRNANFIASEDASKPQTKIKERSVWRKLSENMGFGEETCSRENGPDRVEVYYFERGCEQYLWARGGGECALGERAGARCERSCGRALAEVLAALLAAPKLMLTLAVATVLHVERAALTTARAALAGGVRVASDGALKPALALAFNALLLPPLVFAGNVARAVRDALRPLWLALGDAVEPLVRLVAAVRLVDVHVQHV